MTPKKKNKLKLIANIATYLSIFIAGLLLLNDTDSLSAPKKIDLALLSVSTLLLFSGFLLQWLAWHSITNKEFNHIPLLSTLHSISATIFYKYLPGKIWAITGRATHLSFNENLPLTRLNILSTQMQLTSICLGSILALLLTFDILDQKLRNNITLTTIISLSSLFAITVLLKLKRLKTYSIKSTSTFTLPTIILISSMWLCWGIGFCFLSSAINTNLPLSLNFAGVYITSCIIGIAVLFAPGGIGIREAGISTGLVLCGLPLEEGLTIAIISRIWFFFGELFLFTLTFIPTKDKEKRK